MSKTDFYLKWIIVNGVGEAIGLGSTFILGMIIAPYLTRTTTLVELLVGFIIAIILGVILEGIIVGFFQSKIIARLLREFKEKEWIIATSIGAGIAWVVGMIPSTVMSFLSNDVEQGTNTVSEPSKLMRYAMALILGLITGPILGFAQAIILKKHVRKPNRWLVANAIAWAFGMLIIFTGMDYVRWENRDVITALSLILVAMLAGIMVGAIHGRFLLTMLEFK